MFTRSVRRSLSTLRKGVAGEIAAIPSRPIRSAMLRSLGTSAKLSESRRYVDITVGFIRKFVAKRSGKSKGGVGIAHQNIHWVVSGTKPRTTRAGQYRGRMPAFGRGVLRRGVRKGLTQFVWRMRHEVDRELQLGSTK